MEDFKSIMIDYLASRVKGKQKSVDVYPGLTASKPTFLHSDMGSQYTSIAYEGLLKRHLIRHSYSKQGYPYDNGPLEAFHSLLKREFIFQTRFTSFEDLVLRVENYINWYNTERIRING